MKSIVVDSFWNKLNPDTLMSGCALTGFRMELKTPENTPQIRLFLAPEKFWHSFPLQDDGKEGFNSILLARKIWP